MSEILIGVTRVAISGFYYTFLRDRIKSWWDHRKILKKIMERIEELCDVRVGKELNKVLQEIGIPEDLIEGCLKEEKKRIKQYKSITLWMEHVSHLKAFITNLFKLYEIELGQLYEQKLSDKARKLLKIDIPSQVEDVLLELKPNKVIIQTFKKVSHIENELNKAIETASIQKNYDQFETLLEQELRNLYRTINALSTSQGTALLEIKNLKLQLQAFQTSELHKNIFDIKNLISEGFKHIYTTLTEISESPKSLLQQITIPSTKRDTFSQKRQIIYDTCEKCDKKFPNDFFTVLRNKGQYICPNCGVIFPGLTTFLSGTSKVKRVFENVSEKLKENGYKISWYLDEFRAMSNNVIDDCFQNLRKADRVIIVIGKDYGSKYNDTNHSITEEEWRQALEQEKRILIFVEADVYEEYKRLDKIIEPEYDLRIHKFIQEAEENKKNWVFKFEWINDIVNKVLSSWGCFVEKEEKKIDLSRNILFKYNYETVSRDKSFTPIRETGRYKKEMISTPTSLYEGERFEKSLKKTQSPVTRGYPIDSLESLEIVWNNRNKYLRESNPRGVTTLQDFWGQQCSEEAWYPTPTQFANMWVNNNVWLITGAPGNGKTMFLLTIAKNLVKYYDENPPKMVFFQPWAFLDVRQFEEFPNHIVFADLPPASNLDILINSIYVGVKNGCTIIITLYTEDAEKVHGRLLKKDIHLGELVKIDEGPDRAQRLNLTIDKMLDGWNINTKSFRDDAEVKKMILKKMGVFNRLKRVQYELLFLSHNLFPYKDNKITPNDIEEFIEPTKYAYRTLRHIIKDECAFNFIRGFELLLKYLNSLENGSQQQGLNDIPIFVHKDGIIHIISNFKKVPNFAKALKKARILESINGDFLVFDKMGFGGRVYEEYKSHFKDTYDYNITELENIENTLMNKAQEQEETGNYISGVLLDLLRLIISKGLPKEMLISTVEKLKIFFKDSYAYNETIRLLLLYGNNLILKDILKAIEHFEFLSKIEPSNPIMWFCLGFSLNQKGDLNGAIEAFKKTVKINPEFMNTWQYIGDILKEKGEFEETIEAYKKSLAIYPNNPDVWLKLGIALENRDDFEEAIKAYKKGLEINPEDKWLLYNLGNVFIKIGNPDDAVTAYRKSLMIDPKEVAILGNLGAALHNTGNVDEAITAFKNVIEIDSQDVNAWNNLGVVLKDEGELDEAIGAYMKALEIDPQRTLIWNNLGDIFINTGNIDGAIDAYRKALELNPTNLKTWSNLAGALFEKGDISESIKACKKAIEIDPTNAEMQFNLGTAFRKIGKIDMAMDAYKKGLRINSNYPDVWHSLGLVLNNKGDLDGAINAYRKSLKLNSQNANLWNNLGIALDNKGDLDGAIESYKKSLDIDSELTKVWINYGNSLFKNDNLNGAIWAYERALRLDPTNEKAIFNLNIAHKNRIYSLMTIGARIQRTSPKKPKFVSKQKVKQKGRSAKKWSEKAWFFFDKQLYLRAKECWERAVKVDPQYILGWIYLGTAFVMLNEFKKAEECFKKALILKPENSEILLMLGQVYLKQGNLKTAQDILLKATKFNPYDKRVWRQLGLIQEELGNLKLAQKYFQKTIEIDPTDIESLIKLGTLYFNRENFEEAKKYLETAFECLVKDPEFNLEKATEWTILSICFYAMREFSRAKECLKKVKEIDPNSTLSWNDLESILNKRKDLTKIQEFHKKNIENEQNE